MKSVPASDAAVVLAASKRPRGEGTAEGIEGPAHQAAAPDGSGQLEGAASQPATQPEQQQQQQPQFSEPGLSEFPFSASAMQGVHAEMSGGDVAGGDERQKHANALAYLESMLGVAQQQSQASRAASPGLCCT